MSTGGTGGFPLCALKDPVDGEIIADDDADCGIWVSSSLGDDAHPGTRGQPVQTLTKAIELASADGGPGRVYACAEVYPEAVVLAHVSLFGGFRCSAPGWPYHVGEAERAEILAPPSLAALMLLESDVVSRVLDVDVTAADAVAPGGSSIAVLAQAGSKAFFSRSRLTSGDGADGVDGEDGSHNNQPAPPGMDGIDGAPACLMPVGIGGPSVNTQCPNGGGSVGGSGGDANAVAAQDGAPGIEPPDPNPQGYGAGGKAQNAAAGASCTGGEHGAPGQDGDDGVAATGDGKLTSIGVIGADGGDGEPGLPGQGGGGGGASLGAACQAAGGPQNGGAGGGSGGSGGCGGKAGKGGQAGGSSFVFALLSSGISADQVVLHVGNGGHGGHGGVRQIGGKGGLPGYGGIGYGGAAGAPDGCPGGVGGYGGNGGAGAGGHGGNASIVGAPAGIDLETGAYTPILGMAGQGGLSGNPGGSQKGKPGQDGAVTTLDPG